MRKKAKPETSPTLAQIKDCCRALDDKKAENLTVLYLGEKSSIADYFVIVTGMSEPHLKALGNTVQETLKHDNVRILGGDSDIRSGWLVVDACDFIVHIFTRKMRERYNLETLWKDADVIPAKKLLE